MAEEVTFTKANDFTIRKVRTVEIVEDVKLDDIAQKKETLLNARQSTVTAHQASLKWFDDQIAELDAMTAEAGKLSLVTEVAHMASVALEEAKLEPVEEIIEK